MPVWPFLMGLCVVASIWNWRAALPVFLCVAGVRINMTFDLSQPLVAHMVLYSVMAFLSVFFLDVLAGAALAIVSVLMGLVFFEAIPHRAEIIASEIVLVLGLAASAYSGPCGGIFGGCGAGPFRRRGFAPGGLSKPSTQG